MGISNRRKILKDGLVFAIDAANPHTNDNSVISLVDGVTASYESGAVREIIKFTIQRNSIKNILQEQNYRKLDQREQQRTNQLINDCIKHIKKSYLNRYALVVECFLTSWF